jgi:hypothetical protein
VTESLTTALNTAGADNRNSRSSAGSNSSLSQAAGDQECLYVGVKARRGVVALSCAHVSAQATYPCQFCLASAAAVAELSMQVHGWLTAVKAPRD